MSMSEGELLGLAIHLIPKWRRCFSGSATVVVLELCSGCHMVAVEFRINTPADWFHVLAASLAKLIRSHGRYFDPPLCTVEPSDPGPNPPPTREVRPSSRRARARSTSARLGTRRAWGENNRRCAGRPDWCQRGHVPSSSCASRMLAVTAADDSSDLRLVRTACTRSPVWRATSCACATAAAFLASLSAIAGARHKSTGTVSPHPTRPPAAAHSGQRTHQRQGPPL